MATIDRINNPPGTAPDEDIVLDKSVDNIVHGTGLELAKDVFIISSNGKEIAATDVTPN